MCSLECERDSACRERLVFSVCLKHWPLFYFIVLYMMRCEGWCISVMYARLITFLGCSVRLCYDYSSSSRVFVFLWQLLEESRYSISLGTHTSYSVCMCVCASCDDIVRPCSLRRSQGEDLQMRSSWTPKMKYSSVLIRATDRTLLIFSKAATAMCVWLWLCSATQIISRIVNKIYLYFKKPWKCSRYFILVYFFPTRVRCGDNTA